MDLLARAAETKSGGDSSEGSPGRSSSERVKRAEPTPFVMKLYELVSDPSTDDLCTWTEAGDAFVVLEPGRFTSEILPRYFKHHNFSSFVRQLNQYAFNKSSCVRLEYRNPNFRRGRHDLLALIERRPNRRPTPPNPSSFGSDASAPSPSGESPKKVRLPSPPPTAPSHEAASSWPGGGYGPRRPAQFCWGPYHGRSAEVFSSSGNVGWPILMNAPGAYGTHSPRSHPPRLETASNRNLGAEQYISRPSFSPDLASKMPLWSRSEDAPTSTLQNMTRSQADSVSCTFSEELVKQGGHLGMLKPQLSSVGRPEKSPTSALVATLRQRLEAENTEYVHINTVLSLVAEIEAQQERELFGICTETMHIVDRFRSHLLALCARRCGRACEFAVEAAVSVGGRSTTASNPPSGGTESPMDQALSSTTTDAQAASTSMPGSTNQGMLLDEQSPDV